MRINSQIFRLLLTRKKEDYFWKVLNSGNLIYVGARKSFNIILEDFLGLRVGEKVSEIGEYTGKGQATLNRVDKFNPYITYAGYRYEKIHVDDPEKYQILLFEVRKEDTPEVVKPTDKLYYAYIVLWDEDSKTFELKSPASLDSLTFQIYRPKFKRYDGRD